MKTIKNEVQNLELFVEKRINEFLEHAKPVSKNLKGEKVIKEFRTEPNNVLTILANNCLQHNIIEISYEILEDDTVKIQVTLIEEEYKSY